MAQQIIKQPNGKYCIFSSICDNVIAYNLTEEQVEEHFIKDASKTIRSNVKNIITDLDKGLLPYYQFTKDYPQMLEIIRLQHGEHQVENVKNIIEV